MNIIVNDGKYDIDHLVKKSKEFLATRYSTKSYRKLPFFNAKEIQYDYNDPTIFIEEYLPNGIHDHKFYVIDGEIAFMAVNHKTPGQKKYYKNLYDSDFNFIKYRKVGKQNIKKDLVIDDKNKKLFKRFSKEFYEKERLKFVRLDFFIQNNEVYLGEFTFTPDNCMEKYSEDFERVLYDKYIKNNKNLLLE